MRLARVHFITACLTCSRIGCQTDGVTSISDTLRQTRILVFERKKLRRPMLTYKSLLCQK